LAKFRLNNNIIEYDDIHSITKEHVKTLLNIKDDIYFNYQYNIEGSIDLIIRHKKETFKIINYYD
jgi:hypothetical protein